MNSFLRHDIHHVIDNVIVHDNIITYLKFIRIDLEFSPQEKVINYINMLIAFIMIIIQCTHM